MTRPSGEQAEKITTLQINFDYAILKLLYRMKLGESLDICVEDDDEKVSEIHSERRKSKTNRDINILSITGSDILTFSGQKVSCLLGHTVEDAVKGDAKASEKDGHSKGFKSGCHQKDNVLSQNKRKNSAVSSSSLNEDSVQTTESEIIGSEIVDNAMDMSGQIAKVDEKCDKGSHETRSCASSKAPEIVPDRKKLDSDKHLKKSLEFKKVRKRKSSGLKTSFQDTCNDKESVTTEPISKEDKVTEQSSDGSHERVEGGIFWDSLELKPSAFKSDRGSSGVAVSKTDSECGGGSGDCPPSESIVIVSDDDENDGRNNDNNETDNDNEGNDDDDVIYYGKTMPKKRKSVPVSEFWLVPESERWEESKGVAIVDKDAKEVAAQEKLKRKLELDLEAEAKLKEEKSDSVESDNKLSKSSEPENFKNEFEKRILPVRSKKGQKYKRLKESKIMKMLETSENYDKQSGSCDGQTDSENNVSCDIDVVRAGENNLIQTSGNGKDAEGTETEPVKKKRRRRRRRKIVKDDKMDNDESQEVPRKKSNRKPHRVLGALACEVCGKEFYQRDALQQLNRHMRSHDNECKICHMKMSYLQLQEHYRDMHENEEEMTCEHCDKTFTFWKQYIRHVESVHENPSTSHPYRQSRDQLCHLCGKLFTKGYMQKHLESSVHYNTRQYICDSCPKRFTSTYHLKRHLRIHSGEEPFPCTHCGKRFGDKSNRDVHVQAVHLKSFPYKCQVCTKEFRRKKHLRIHVKEDHPGHYFPDLENSGTFHFPDTITDILQGEQVEIQTAVNALEEVTVSLSTVTPANVQSNFTSIDTLADALGKDFFEGKRPGFEDECLVEVEPVIELQTVSM